MIAGVGEITRILPPREHKLSCNLSRGINYAIDAELFVVCRLCKHFRSGNRRIVSTVNFVTSGTFNALWRSLWFNTKIKITFGLSIEWQAGDSTSGLPKLQGIPRCGDVKKKKGKFSLQRNPRRVASVRKVNRRLSRVAYPVEQFVFSLVFSDAL